MRLPYIAAQASDVMTLAKLASVTIVKSAAEIPEGCCAEPIDGNLQLYVQLKGIVDFGKEVSKLNKELAKLEGMVSRPR